MVEEYKELELDDNSKELVIKWQRQAEALKKRHPEWDAEKIEQEMKQFIISDAEKVFSSKDGKAYVEELKALIQKAEAARNRAIESIMIYMGKTSPDAVATALFELNCGCIRACAVSDEGAPMGEMIMVSGRQVEEDYECSICENDGGTTPERCINKAIVWPGEESELPSEEFRLAIGKKVFGDEYSLDDI
ncbi:hypothetical protein [Desulfogranum japonicum]|uniref:hypothetical protein n=1 Tax=Desulfogranum japonicum TaxID=231447 RepID=UPI00041C0FDE|nr:hypothetical protein [Desulfogranum japonicum]